MKWRAQKLMNTDSWFDFWDRRANQNTVNKSKQAKW